MKSGTEASTGKGNMRAKNQEIVMPEKSRAMTQEEMEYEGGVLNFLISAACFVVDVGAGLAADAGMISRDTATAIQVGATAVGAITSFGITTAVMAGTKVVGEKTIEYTTKNVAKWAIKEGSIKPAVSAVSIGNTLNGRGSNSRISWGCRLVSLW